MYSAEFVRRGARATAERIAGEITAAVVDALRGAVHWRPGARELLAQAVALSIPTALVTMAYRPVAEAIAAATNLPVFDVVVAGDEVQHSKPHPEPYTRALAALGVDPSDALAVEDTLVGARSAEAAGLRTVVVPSHSPVEPAPGRRVIASLADVRLIP
jgi:HAD superfamily hydrolase (TIGR01509 family)